MTVTASEILTKCGLLLFDPAQIKWPQTELLGWLSDAQRAVVALMPEASSFVTTMQLAASARQVIPSGGYMLLQVTRYMGTNGTTPGGAIKRVDMHVLDETNPTWYAAAAGPAPTVYTYNTRDRTGFYVSPPSDGTGYVEINYSQSPTEITSSSQALQVTEMFVPPLIDYVMWRCLSKPVPFADPKRADAYFKSWAMWVNQAGQSQAVLAGEMGDLIDRPPQGMGSQRGG